MTDPQAPIPAPEATVQHEAAQRSRRSFLTLAVAGLAGWRWLVTRPDLDGVLAPLRRILDADARLAAGYYRSTRLAPVFPKKPGSHPTRQRQRRPRRR